MFNALCENAKAEAANYPFCTIEPNVGIVAVPDERLEVSDPSSPPGAFQSLTAFSEENGMLNYIPI